MPDSDGQLEIKRLTEWVKTNLALSSPFRALQLQEDDALGIDDYLAKCSTWMALARLEDRSGKYGWE